MKIIHYCQHVLGMGHFFRSLEISRALQNEQVIFVSGGTKPAQQLPDHVEYFQLPGLCMDESFGGLTPTDEGRAIDEVKADRIEKIKILFEQKQPDIFLIELFPFGRKAFRFELLPILDSIKAGLYGNVKVICSLRDILVEKNDGGKHEKRCVETLNKYFDLLLIHSDPQIAKLDETFQAMNDIAIPYLYTGFVARKPNKNIRGVIRKQLGISTDEKLLVVSAGGGKVGESLLKAVFDSFAELNIEKTKLLMLTGPFFDNDKYDLMKTASLSLPNITVEKFAPDFPNLLTGADAMISMAGYNTCMDILTTNIPSAVLPFAQNREQRMRAEKLAEHISLKIMNVNDLNNTNMKTIITDLLTSEHSSSDHSINLDGALNSAREILMAGKR
ncbi:glycosyltransferase family protein [Desulfovibrio gilichinskyi]|uniref:Predicted glycosyl transferase n=1 Tax=Desulfovibrio gilichinskyi TaxID=1519643 RepID=A0A1X7C9D5_9BACT|nr:glycosyltransferase [Desulfovibrio gilichinskyi]SME92372.1 Predicted glycosyl transferase [Desulfovibrio gilichinskyi]